MYLFLLLQQLFLSNFIIEHEFGYDNYLPMQQRFEVMQMINRINRLDRQLPCLAI